MLGETSKNRSFVSLRLKWIEYNVSESEGGTEDRKKVQTKRFALKTSRSWLPK